MISEESFYGGSTERTISADIRMHRLIARLWVLTPTTSGLKAYLPEAHYMRTGGRPAFYVINVDGGTPYDISIVDFGGNAVGTVSAGECATIVLEENDDADGTWWMWVDTVGSAANPGSTKRAYFMGGYGNSPSTPNDCFELDTQLAVFTEKTASTYGHSYGAASAVGEQAYVTGSDNPYGDRLQCEQYDPDTWTTKTARTQGSYWHGMGSADSKVYVFGGGDAGDKTRTDEYDLSSTWTDRATIPWSVQGCSAGSIDRTGGGAPTVIMLTGGSANASPHSDNAYEYDPNSFTQKTAIPYPERGNHSSAVINDRMYITCGGDGAVALDDTTEFDPDTNSWTAKLDHPFGTQDQQTFCEANAKGYWLEGQTTGATDSYEYDADDNTWTYFKEKTTKAHTKMNQCSEGIVA